MFQDFFARSNLLSWPVVGLVIFLTIFISMLAYVFLGLRDRKKIDKVASLPLEDDTGSVDRSEGESSR